MDESLENIFLSMVRQGDISGALDFIRSVDNYLPSKDVMQTIIFEILMKNDDIRCLALSSDYLITVLNAFPPCDEEHRQFYYDSVRSSSGFFNDLWTVFCHTVDSYFIHREIYIIEKDDNCSDPIKYPNCKFLLEFYVRLFAFDFEYLYCESFSPCLMMKLLWPSGDIGLSSQTAHLLKWINDIYTSSFANDNGDLLGSMHELLTLMVKCIIQGKHSLTESAAFCNPSLTEIVEAIINFCKGAFTSLANVKLFLASLSLKYLQARVSERIIRQIIRPSSKQYVQLLRDIVDQYMFPQKSNKCRNLKPNMNKEKNLRKRSIEKKSIVLDKKMKSTKLHELCKKNKFGDLLEAMESSCENVNARDHTGSTPLHEACQMGNYMCVKVLISETAKASTHTLDFTAVNLEGHTPLHIAVMKNATDIARELLHCGGSELLTVTDNKGHYPSDLSNSEEMDKILEEYQLELSATESDSNADNRVKEAPVLKSFKENSIYLHALNCLLCTYCNIFNLYDFVWNKNIVVQSHNDKKCCHYTDQNVCSEDAVLISEMPDLVEVFIQSIRKKVSKSELNIDIELIPLKAFAASLKAP